MDLKDFSPSLTSFGRIGAIVTPSDDTDLPGGSVKAIVLLTAGDVSLLPAGSDVPLDFEGLPSGFIPPFIVRRVLATGTTATVATVHD